MIKVCYVPCLFEENRIEFFTRNLTVASILLEMMRKHPEIREDGAGFQVRVNGKILSPFKYRKELEDGDEVLIIQEVGIFTAILTAIGGIFGAGWTAAAGAAAIGWAAAVTVAAVLDVVLTLAAVVYSYCSTDKAKKTGLGLSTSPTYGWDGVQTQSRPGVPVPIAYGEHMLGGNIIGSYVSSDGDINYLNMLIALCEGPIEGIMKEDLTDVCADNSDTPYILINDNPFSNFGGSVEWDFRLGEDEQTAIPGFTDIINMYSLGSPHITTASSYTYTTVGDDVEAFELRFRVPALYASHHGNYYPSAVQVNISHSVHDAEDWVDDGGFIISGSSQNPLRRYWRIDGLTPAQYDIKVVRATADPSPPTTAGDIYWDYVSEISYDELTHPLTSLLRLKIQATDVLSGQVPSIKVLGRWKKVLNLDTDVVEWSQNPIYCMNDLLVGQSGAGRYITQANINNDQLIEQADYCDEIIGDGDTQETNAVDANTLTAEDYTFVDGDIGKTICCKCPTDSTIYTNLVITSVPGGIATGAAGWTKGTPVVGVGWEWGEKRYELDIVIDTQDDALSLISQVCGSFRCAPLWVQDGIQLIIDKKGDPCYPFNMSNILSGSFQDAFTSLKSIPNAIDVNFADRNQNYTKQTIGFADHEAIEAGEPLRPATMDLFGATRPSQVMREARFHTWAYKYQDEQISFRGGIDSIHVMPGDIIQFQHDVTQWGYGGRIVSATIASVTLDKEVEIEEGESYQITVRQKDGSGLDILETREITNAAGFHTVITVGANFSLVPEAYGLWLIEKVAGNTKTFRMMSAKRTPENEVEVVASEYHTQCYSDTDIILPIPVESMLPNPVLCLPVTNLSIKERGNVLGDGTWVPYVEVGFQKPENEGLIGWDHAEIWVGLSNTYYEYYGNATQPGFKIDTHDFLKVGNTIYVKAISVNKNGVKTNFTNSPYKSLLLTGKAEGPSDITGFNATQYTDKVVLSWNLPEDKDIRCYEIREGTAWDTAQIVATQVFGLSLTLFLFNSGWNNFLIKGIDASGNYSENAAECLINITIASAGSPVATLNGLLNPSSFSNTTLQKNVLSYNRVVGLTPTREWDDGSDWDSGNWDLPVELTGYFITKAIDLGSVQNVMFSITDQYSEDGDGQTYSVEIAISDDDISYSAFEAFVSATTYSCRFAKFKITLETDNANENILCFQFDINAYNFGGFQAWQTAVQEVSTQAISDGFLVVKVTYDTAEATSTIKADSATPPTTLRCSVVATSTITTQTMTCPIKKGDYYLIEIGGAHTATAFFIPIVY